MYLVNHLNPVFSEPYTDVAAIANYIVTLEVWRYIDLISAIIEITCMHPHDAVTLI